MSDLFGTSEGVAMRRREWLVTMGEVAHLFGVEMERVEVWMGKGCPCERVCGRAVFDLRLVIGWVLENGKGGV